METIKLTKVWGYIYDQAEGGEKLVDLSRISAKICAEISVIIVLTRTIFCFMPSIGVPRAMKQKGGLAAAGFHSTDFHIHPIFNNG